MRRGVAWRGRLRTVAAVLTWGIGAVVAAAQGLELHVAPTTVSLDDVVTAVVRLSGASVVTMQQPSLRCPSFAVEALAPIEGRRTANGRQWRFLLIPVDIGPARVDATLPYGNADLTASVDVRVVSVAGPTRGPAKLRDDVTGVRFVTASVDEPAVYLHQQVTYRFRYYFETWLPAGETPQYGFPPFDGFSSEAAGQTPADESRRARIDGRDLFVEEIDMGLFPIVSGRLEIGPTRLVLPRAVAGGRDLLTESVQVTVMPLPTPTPTGFSGGVGEFAVAASAPDGPTVIGEGARILVRVSGRGDLDTLTNGPTASSPHGEVFIGPVATTRDVVDGMIGGERTYEFVLVPSAAGVAFVDIPSLSTFSPDSAAYVASDARRVPVTVTSVADGTQPIPRPRRAAWRKSVWRGLAVVLMASAALWAWVRLRGRRMGGRAAGKTTVSPRETTDALSTVEIGDGERVCREVGRHVREYASSVLGVHPVDLATKLRDDPTSGAEAVAAIIARCEQGVYAPSSPGEPEQAELVRDAIAAVEQIAGERHDPGHVD